MSIHVALNHRTTYSYDRLVALGPQVIRLKPAPHCRTPILSYSLKVEPADHFINWQQDPQANHIARLVFPERTRKFSVEVDLVADMAVINPFDFFLEAAAEEWPFAYDPWLAPELAPYLVTEAPGPLLKAWLASIPREKTKTIDFLVALNQRLQREIGYVIRLEPGIQPCELTLGSAKGSCRDTGWLLVQILRHLGLAARFVSGYLIQLVPDVKPLEGPEGPTKDFTDLHAWCEVYLPGAGWIGLDPTSGLMAGEGHIPLAASPSPESAAPITGLVDEAKTEFGFAMTVTRLREAARVTKPYTDAQWRRIEALGHVVDQRLARGDVRLTMGGEPTFVSIDDMDGEEWNTAALGPTKRRLAGTLLKRLTKRWAPGAMLHYGQGKWYPGEQLPRWALGCWWRRDGEAIWRDPELFADDARKTGADVKRARRFARALAERLQVDPAFLIDAFEDAWYYLWREQRLPVNVDPLKSKLKDKEERARLARVFERGLDESVGQVLPLTRARDNGKRWKSGFWFVRPQHMFLIPGDSPMGYRLPLDSLPWAAPGDISFHVETDPFAPLDKLPPRATRPDPAQRYEATGRAPSGAATDGRTIELAFREAMRREREATAPGSSAGWVVRTALCVEPRDGNLHIFMPPVDSTEDYLDLVAAIEDTAEDLGEPVMLEGYAPPSDPRLNHFSVTPDPGVIEVNVHPATSWADMVARTTELYEEARQCRLGSEKFMLDGRHVGTGGGNHIVMGGASAAESPFLRRPDLLRSLVGYWLNHPSLSMLFSGQFLGPTSQHPRIDEARNDAIRELEIAFQQLDGKTDAPPWLVDRVFRNILVDVTGNTHRTEFCIDKLYSPDFSGGRRGLVELRAFEMPPHARMSLAQQLLLRAMIARFWDRPYAKRLVRWGTAIHDKFMLPHFVDQDFGDVLDDLKADGFGFERDWFDSHFEFRFPVIGTVAQRGLELEIRHALEPWHVLGEEVGAAGTVRYVDSALERVQARVTNATDSRHVVTVNGRALPLHPTGVNGEYVAGVRFKAWAPPSALHPTIGVHTPLVFDIVDTWSGRSVGGCTYHVMHPGGRNYERFPVNANEAEARRRSRFVAQGHTPGPLTPKPSVVNPEYPMTFDLRSA